MKKKWIRFTQHLLALLIFAVPAMGQSSVVINGRTFLQQNSSWYEEYLGELFTVNDNFIIVKLSSTTPVQTLHQFHVNNGILNYTNNGFGFEYLQIPNGADPIVLAQQYNNSGLVEYAEPSVHGKYLGIPNDQHFPQQWYLDRIKMPQAWNIETGNSSVIVAILDTGTDWNHEDIGPGSDGYQNVWLNETVGPYGTTENDWSDPTNPVTGQKDDDDQNGSAFHTYKDDWKGWRYGRATYPDPPDANEDNDSRDYDGHGTAVAGIVAAKTNNNMTGIAGIAGGWNSSGVRMMIHSMGLYDIHDIDLADAIYYAAQKGARVIQLSLGIAQSGVIDNALIIAHDTYGCLIVCASGNSNSQFVSYPARHEKVVAVGATNENDFRCSPPDWEPECLGCGSNYGLQLDLAAPGKHIFTTLIGGGYGWESTDAGNGTSYSAPQVSGLAALLLCYNPSYTHDDLESIMKQTADKTGGYNYNWDPMRPGHSRELGYGRINAYRALSMANGTPGAPQNLQVSAVSVGTNPRRYSPQLTWSANTEVDMASYKIYRHLSSEPGGFGVIGTVSHPTGSYIDYSVQTGNLDFAYYKITAVDAAPLESGFSNEVSIQVNATSKPSSGEPMTVQYFYDLSEAYPNPSNPTTMLRYSLQEDVFVSLKVFDLLGREVIALVQEYQRAGTHQVHFDASALTSGTYIYRIVAGNYSATKKMMVIK